MKEILEADCFFQLQEKFSRIPFTQSQGWYNYMKGRGKEVIFYVDNDQDPKIGCWGTLQKIPFSKRKILLIGAETYSPDLTEMEFKSFYSELATTHDAIEVNSSNPYDIEFETGIRRAGFKRPIGIFDCPLTIEIDLSQKVNVNKNWKRNVKKGTRAGLNFEEITSIQPSEIKAIVSLFKELKELKGLHFELEEISLSRLLKSEEIRTFIVYDQANNPISASINHVNHPYCTNIFSVNSHTSRECGAAFFILDSIFAKLKSEKFLYFDFARIPPSDHATDSVYVFKNSSRGKKLQYNGEWTYYKNEKLELAVFLYKCFKTKKQRY